MKTAWWLLVLAGVIACSSNEDDGSGSSGGSSNSGGKGGSAGSSGAAGSNPGGSAGSGGLTGGSGGSGGGLAGSAGNDAGGLGGAGGEAMCPPCAPPPLPDCIGFGPCGCGPYACPSEGAGGGEACGEVTCQAPLECCNPVNSQCAPPGQVCVQ